MDAKQEFALYWMKLGRKVFMGPGNEAVLSDCDTDIKEIEEWAAAGNPGLPERFNKALGWPNPVDHESSDGLKCTRCGIEKIYREHFPDCSRFKPLSNDVRMAFRS